ncbi:GH19886 [Drosophila grimshawi]|uniref:GH19886 n=1 Tax=Drosophila grimshawi TaxID=7222 RepID=B4J971_DROGR|nr:GH19886 [Drosophila grimshawi]
MTMTMTVTTMRRTRTQLQPQQQQELHMQSSNCNFNCTCNSHIMFASWHTIINLIKDCYGRGGCTQKEQLFFGSAEITYPCQRGRRD